MTRYFISMYTDGPSTSWNVIDRNTQEWVRRFSSAAEANANAIKRNAGIEIERLHQRIAVLEMVIREELPGIDCCDKANKMIVDGVHEKMSPPEFLFDCGACGGQGYIARTVQVYEPGCGFSHPDVEETPCQACNGIGWFIGEVEGD